MAFEIMQIVGGAEQAHRCSRVSIYFRVTGKHLNSLRIEIRRNDSLGMDIRIVQHRSDDHVVDVRVKRTRRLLTRALKAESN